MKLWQKNMILLICVILLCVIPLFLQPSAEFAGADGQAEDLIGQIAPDYQPWFTAPFAPASGEIESLLFALQATLGGAVLGFGFGRLSAKAPKKL